MSNSFPDEYHKPDTCSRCGSLMSFQGVGEYKCDRCGHIEYDDYGIVRNFIEEHKGATVVEISAFTGISQTQIQKMLRDERLQIAENSRIFLKCMGCGKEIRTGNYCPVCAKLAAAAQAKKKAAAEREAHKHNYVGFESDLHSGEGGAKRFRRGDDIG